MPADTSWTFEPGALALIATLSVAYGVRFRRVRREHGWRVAPTGRAWCFALGVALLVVALVSPVDRLAGQSFVMHMVQHLILLDLAAIALICGLTKVILRPVTRRLLGLERAAGPLAHPAFAAVAYVAVMWLWHVPALYDAALEHGSVHVLEHVTLLSVGLLYWWHLLGPIPGRHRLTGMAPIVYMGFTKVLVGLLGIGLTFAPDALYPYYESRAPIWGLDPGADQALGGALMALEQSVVMGVALALLFVRALEDGSGSRRAARRYAA